MQREILEEVAARGVTTMEALRWEMGPKLGPSASKLPNSWNTSFSRAIESLKSRGFLQVTDRPLANLEEWKIHYPGKTLNPLARRLRLDLIPHLIEWMESLDGPSPRYTRAENEQFALKLFNREHVAAMTANWKTMKPTLFSELGLSHSPDLFLLVARGTQLFEASQEVASRRPFRSLADDCLAKNLVPASEIAEMKKLVSDLLTTEEAGALRFRSYMHSLTKGIPSRGHCELSIDAKEELYRRRPDYMAKLPGFKPPPSKTSIHSIMNRGRATHGPILKKILDQSVFHTFRFLAIPEASSSAPNTEKAA